MFKNTIKATLSSRYMIYTGLTILVFLIYHLYQYTLRVGYDPRTIRRLHLRRQRGDIRRLQDDCQRVQQRRCSAFYILAILMLFSHLRHGVQSIFQTGGP